MLVYVLLCFAAICIGMAISSAAFGTGSKKAKIFKEIYFSIEEVDGISVYLQKPENFLQL